MWYLIAHRGQNLSIVHYLSIVKTKKHNWESPHKRYYQNKWKTFYVSELLTSKISRRRHFVVQLLARRRVITSILEILKRWGMTSVIHCWITVIQTIQRWVENSGSCGGADVKVSTHSYFCIHKEVNVILGYNWFMWEFLFQVTKIKMTEIF